MHRAALRPSRLRWYIPLLRAVGLGAVWRPHLPVMAHQFTTMQQIRRRSGERIRSSDRMGCTVYTANRRTPGVVWGASV
ncbi:hypothetical protein BJ912DRAFT_970702 [Pholiota molesta]|nr:hypothetical protein BJ912DRAFT_970702 [Pholiota molesta]